MYIQEPVKILENFLRSKLSEVTRNGLLNRLTNDSQSFSGDNSETEFVLTNQPVCINTIEIDSTEVYPYTDFNIDLNNKTIKFRTAPANGTNNIVISFKKATGSNWIYADKPRVDMQKTEYPRIGIVKISEPGNFNAMGQTDMNHFVVVQFDILAYRRMLCTVGSDTISGNDVSEYLARQLVLCFKNNIKNYLSYRIMDMELIDSSPVPFEPNQNVFRHMVQMRFNFRNNEEII